MTFKFTLTDPIGGTKVISEPGGWDTATIGLERHPQLLSLVEFFKSSFQTYGSNGSEDGGRDWILGVEKTYGPDAQIKCLIEIDNNDTGVFKTLFNCVLGVSQFVETLDQDHLLQIVFANSDFWTKFISRYQSQVDLRSTVDMDGNVVAPTPKFTLPLPSQVIDKAYSAYKSHNSILVITNRTNPIVLFGFDVETLKEIESQSALVLSAVDGNGSVYPQPNQVIPTWNVTDDGEFIINNLLLTLSAGDILDDPNWNFSADYVNAQNGKARRLDASVFGVYLQKNNDAPIRLAQANRTVPTSFVRNDGVTETLQVPARQVTDFSLPANTTLRLQKNDAVKVYGQFLTASPPFTTAKGLIFMWGKDGWSHDSGFDQIINAGGSYWKFVSGGLHNESNQGAYAWGGYYDASVNAFPSSIDDDAGTGQSIQAGNWWNVANDGNLGGVPVTNKNVITAKVNNPTNSIADWTIGLLTPFEGLEAYGPNCAIDVIFHSTAKDSSTDAFLTHDIGAGITDRITGQRGLFYSEFLGNPYTSRVYAGVGCGSLKANMKGLHVRGYSLADKPLSLSMQDWVAGINPIDCIGIGYEKLGGIDVIRAEQAKYFFDDSSMSILLSNVQTIKRSYDPNYQFNSVDYGYAKWQSVSANGVGAPSGIDDAQSQGTRNTLFKYIGKKFKTWSVWIAASLAIETIRRLDIKLTSNYTYDDEVIVIALHNNGDGTFTPELDENYSSIIGLSNSSTRYNTSLSSSRNFLRWLPYLSGCLQAYLSSFFTFSSGQGNSTMSSTKTTACPGDETGVPIAENGDIPIGTDFLFLPIPFDIDHYMDADDYDAMVANKNLAIGVSQTESGHKPFFITKFERVISTGLVKLTAWPKEPFDIIVPETPSPVTISKYFEQPYFEDQFE